MSIKSLAQMYFPSAIVFAVRRTTNMTVVPSPGTLDPILFSTGNVTEDFDAFGFHDPATNSSRVTPTIAGTYALAGSVFWNSAANTTIRKTILRTAGTTTIPGTQALANNLNNQLWSQPAPVAIFSFNGTTDYVELCVDSGTASSVVFGNSSDGCMLVMWLIR